MNRSAARKRKKLTPKQRVSVPADVVEFLLGIGPLEGCHFGERPNGAQGAFWWRKYLHGAKLRRRLP